MTTSKKTKEKAAPESDVLHLQRLDSETISVPIRGTTPLIMHRFSEKAKRAMLDKMQGRKTPKTKREPERDYEESMYHLNGGYGFPATGFKKAAIGAARFYGDVSMTELRQYLFFHGETGDDGINLVPIEGEPRMREDVVRLQRKTTDLRYRGEFPDWKAKLKVTYISSAISRESVLSLIDAGGLGVGVGEWRPERGGEFGCYEIDPERKVEVVS
jgi:hypothetical protein